MRRVAESRVMSEQAESPRTEPVAAPSSDGARGAKGDGAAGRDKTVPPAPSKEIGGRDGPEPVRYGDWEKNGRCIDF